MPFLTKHRSKSVGDATHYHNTLTAKKSASNNAKLSRHNTTNLDDHSVKFGFCGYFVLLIKKKASARKGHGMKNRSKRDTLETVPTTDCSNASDNESQSFAISTCQSNEKIRFDNKQQQSVESPRSNLSSCPSFVTCVESESELVCPLSEDNYKKPAVQVCACTYSCHYLEFSPEFPIRAVPDVTPGSCKEALTIAKSLLGHWVTILDRSDPMDTHFKIMGLNLMKRTIMNRLAVPKTCFLEGEGNMVVWIHTPLGVRTMNCNLEGGFSYDHDPDVGKWEGLTKVVEYTVSWFCDTPVRALQQVRKSDRAVVVETRVVLPDKIEKEGKIMLYNIKISPISNLTQTHSADRILRYVGPHPR